MTPTVAIVEPRREFAVTLEEVVALAHCTPLVVDDFQELLQLPSPPAAVVVRITVTALLHIVRPQDHITAARPKIFALASTDADVDEARRLGCDVVLREPQQVRALYDALLAIAFPQ
jgi:hypothetical protein